MKTCCLHFFKLCCEECEEFALYKGRDKGKEQSNGESINKLFQERLFFKHLNLFKFTYAVGTFQDC